MENNYETHARDVKITNNAYLQWRNEDFASYGFGKSFHYLVSTPN